MEPIIIHYNETLIRKAVKAFWWRSTGWGIVAAFLVLLSSFVYLVWIGDRSWLVGFAGTILGLAVIVGVVLYSVHYRGAISRLHRIRTPEATIELSEERFRMSSDAGTSELAWTAITEVWSFPEFLLVFVSRAQFNILPRADLGPAACNFIIDKARTNGAKIS